VRILKELRTDDFGQNGAKSGVCLQVRIPKDLVVVDEWPLGSRGKRGWRRIIENDSTEEVLCQ